MFKKLLIFLILSSCAQVTSLNLKKHQFGRIPTKIIWVQVAGLSPEHLAMLKFSYPSERQNTAFENSLCVGNTWEYNLFEIRPQARSGFMSQMTGKKNINGSCEDYKKKPIWQYIAPKGYKIGVFEGPMSSENSLTQSNTCDQNSYLDDVSLWKMERPSKGSSTFHVNTMENFKAGKVYYDKSCSSGECFTSFSRNVERTFSQFNKNSGNFLFVVRNFEYRNLLKRKKIKSAGEELAQINEILSFFQKYAKDRKDTLVLVTSAEALEVDFPKSGKAWDQFTKTGSSFKTMNSKLVSSVYAYGARAENFCGIFDQSEILSRIFSGAKQQGLEFSIINPFE